MWWRLSRTYPHSHFFVIVGVENHPPVGLMFGGKALPRSVVKRMCHCSLPQSIVVEGTWTMDELLAIFPGELESLRAVRDAGHAAWKIHQGRIEHADDGKPALADERMCQLPADCPNGPGAHEYVGPEEGIMCCTKQPWETSEASVDYDG